MPPSSLNKTSSSFGRVVNRTDHSFFKHRECPEMSQYELTYLNKERALSLNNFEWDSQDFQDKLLAVDHKHL